MYRYFFKLNTAIFVVPRDITVISQSYYSDVQASSSFEHVDTYIPKYVIPTFITEVLHLVVYLQLF